MQERKTIIIAADGSGDFTTLTAAGNRIHKSG